MTRSAPLCPIERECGACGCLQVPYAQQLARKQAQIEQLFVGCEVRPILGMSTPFAYRDKIASPFAPVRYKKAARGGKNKGKGGAKQDVLCGMYAAGTHRIVPCAECAVEHPVGRRVINAVRSLMLKWHVPAYNEDALTGLIRHVVVRVGHESGEVLVVVVTNGANWPQGKQFARQLAARVPEITTVVQNVNTRATNAILGYEGDKTLYGPGFILDTLCGLSFRISAHSFYQVNARQTEVLYTSALDLVASAFAHATAPSGAPTIIDAYCGTGTIGLVAAKRFGGAQVIGVDNVDNAIADARGNATHNGIENARFTCADAGDFMQGLAAVGNRADVVLMDPPRAGATPEFLQAAIRLAPPIIAYISCNPTTQARDCATLTQAGYIISAIQPVDMFPHTNHVENVVLLMKESV